MKFLLVGLGNPGSKYQETRHNIGFKVLEALASASNLVFEPVKHGEMCLLKHRGKQVFLLKPNTFMNLSGKAVNYWMQIEKIPRENIFVITDDLALPFGKIRIRGKGSDGGHNGLRNINEVLGGNNYARLRFGISADFSKGKQVDYVLGEWDSEELMTLLERIRVSSEAVLSFAASGLANTMNNYNNK
jgi:PTH1 family peptidyl-tRNA hydrolase